MVLTKLSKLQKKELHIAKQITDLYQIYIKYIRPSFNANLLKIERNRCLYKPIYLYKLNTKLFINNNFEFYYLLKEDSLNLKLLKQEVLIVDFSNEEFLFIMSFLELIDIITRYKSIINLKAIYRELEQILYTEINQRLFNKKTFHITTFCKLIGISDQTYHARRDEIS